MSQTEKALASYDQAENLKQLRLAERVFEGRILELANNAAEAIVANGGVTRHLGQFTLALFGFDGSEGRTVPAVSEYLQTVGRQTDFYPQTPVALFDTMLMKPEILSLSQTKTHEDSRSALSYRVDISPSLMYDQKIIKGAVMLAVKDGYRRTMRDNGEIISDKNISRYELAWTKRLTNHLADEIEIDDSYAFGWEEIYAKQKLGSDHSRLGLFNDQRMLELTAIAREHFGRRTN